MTQPLRFLRIKDVMERTAMGRTHIYELIKRGDFPAPLDLGAKCSRWVEADVEAWMRSKMPAPAIGGADAPT